MIHQVTCQKVKAPASQHLPRGEPRQSSLASSDGFFGDAETYNGMTKSRFTVPKHLETCKCFVELGLGCCCGKWCLFEQVGVATTLSYTWSENKVS